MRASLGPARFSHSCRREDQLLGKSPEEGLLGSVRLLGRGGRLFVLRCWRLQPMKLRMKMFEAGMEESDCD